MFFAEKSNRQGTQPAIGRIVDDAIWERVQARLSKKRQEQHTKRTNNREDGPHAIYCREYSSAGNAARITSCPILAPMAARVIQTEGNTFVAIPYE